MKSFVVKSFFGGFFFGIVKFADFILVRSGSSGMFFGKVRFFGLVSFVDFLVVKSDIFGIFKSREFFLVCSDLFGVGRCADILFSDFFFSFMSKIFLTISAIFIYLKLENKCQQQHGHICTGCTKNIFQNLGAASSHQNKNKSTCCLVD